MLRERVIDALDRFGSMVGLGHELEVEAAERVVAAVPGVELVRFSNSGTEAVMMALRIARATTGRPLIVRFEGHFHGWSDIAHWSVKPLSTDAGPADAPRPGPAVAGIPRTLAESMIVLPSNDAERLEVVLRDRDHEIAAVIMEPLMANLGCVEARPGYLAQVRALTDLTTMAKALGGGYPVSAVGGHRDVMRLVADQELPYLGTYNTSPVVIAAVNGTLDELSRPGVYERLRELGDRLASGLRDAFRTAGIPATVRGHGPVFQLWFTDEPASTYREAVGQARMDFYRLFHEAMLTRGILFHPTQYEHFFLSTAHTDQHIARTLHAARLAIGEIAKRFA